MDDQRCTLKADSKEPRKPLSQQNINAGKDIIEMIAEFQADRMDEQRCVLPGWKRSDKNPEIPVAAINEAVAATNNEPEEPFFDMLMRCQGSRYNEQRSELPKGNIVHDAEAGNSQSVSTQANPRNTLPDEDFFSLIMRVQGGRMEDQRATVPLKTINKNHNNQPKSQENK